MPINHYSVIKQWLYDVHAPFIHFSIKIICSENNKSIDTTFHYGTNNSHAKFLLLNISVCYCEYDLVLPYYTVFYNIIFIKGVKYGTTINPCWVTVMSWPLDCSSTRWAHNVEGANYCRGDQLTARRRGAGTAVQNMRAVPHLPRALPSEPNQRKNAVTRSLEVNEWTISQHQANLKQLDFP